LLGENLRYRSKTAKFMLTRTTDMPQKLDDRFCRSVAPPTDGRPYALHYDSVCRRFALRVTKAGFKSFVLNYRSHGIERRLTIGSFGVWTTVKAREKAKEYKRLVDQGDDLQAQRYERRSTTMDQLFERWRKETARTVRKNTRLEYERQFRRWIQPELGAAKVQLLSRASIVELHAKISESGAETYANRILALVHRLMSLAVQWKLRPDNPCRGIRHNPERRRRPVPPADGANLLALQRQLEVFNDLLVKLEAAQRGTLKPGDLAPIKENLKRLNRHVVNIARDLGTVEKPTWPAPSRRHPEGRP
jgi:hypothetical protein